MSEQARRTGDRLTSAIDQDFAAAKEALNELRATNAQDWWERQERQMERAAERAEQSVRSLARNWTPPENRDSVATTGTDTDWASRRDRLVTRLEERVRSMERALGQLDPRDFERQELEHTRDRIELMKEDTERVRAASEDEWWELTKERVRAQLDRLDAALDRVAQGRA